MALVVVDYQITLKITCKNKPSKRLKQPVLRGQGRMRAARLRALTPFHFFDIGKISL